VQSAAGGANVTTNGAGTVAIPMTRQLRRIRTGRSLLAGAR
jgi:hypothetical protein